MTSLSSRSGAHVRRAARSAAAILLATVGATCTDHPTSPLASPDDPRFAAGAGGLIVSPASDTTLIGQTITLTASGNGGKAVTWRSSDTTVAIVASSGNATGAVTGRAMGVVTITATAGTKTGTASVRVQPVPIRSITVAPTTASAQLGDSVQYTATPRDSAGQPLAGRVVTWSSADTLVASVSGTGMARPRARGTVQVRATAEGVTGEASFVVVVPQLTIASVTATDSANVGDTLLVRYTVQNAGDTPLADSVIVRVGLRSTANAAVVRAVRRALPRATVGDSVRFTIPATPAGAYTVVAYADCSDVAGVADELRLTQCLATPAAAGTIAESTETDNDRSTSLAVRGAELAATALAAPDTMRTRTSATVSLTMLNSGSATATGFDVVAGLFDVTANTVVSAATIATPVLGSRVSRTVSTELAVPAAVDLTHVYSVRAVADCQNAGVTPVERLQACISSPSGSGVITESNETDNGAARAVILTSNVARVTALPDTIRFTAIGDTSSLSAVAADRAGAPVSGVAIVWTSLDPAASVTTSGVVRSLAAGTARIVAAAEGSADTTIAVVAQLATRVVATPDSVLLTALGDTARFVAAVSDRQGVAMPGAVVSWTSLDPSVASVSAAGTARALAAGRARIVATSGTATDTVIVVAEQAATTVVVTPDSVAAAAGSVVSLAAEVRDASGAVISAKRPAWSTLDPLVASVNDSGRVSALSVGTARIVATRDGHADTAMVLVNPPGYTHRWLGVNAMGWEQPDNWYPHAVPSRVTDSPFIPAGAPQRPYLFNDAVVGSIRLAAGTSLDLRGHNLSVNGSIDAQGSIDSGSVDMRATGVLGGVVPTVTIHAPVLLGARTSAASVAVQDSGRVTINGRTLVASWLAVAGGGSVIQSNPLDSIIVSSASFQGQVPTVLSAGVLRLDGYFGEGGATGAFITSGSHTTILGGSMQQMISFVDSTAGFQNLIVLNPQDAQLRSTMTVRGELRVVNGARLSMPQGTTLRLMSRLPDVSPQGVYDVQTTMVTGPVALQHNHVFDNALFVDQGGSLTLNGHTLEARSLNTYDGTLTMSSPADTLVIRENASFYGRERLSDGTLIARGWFNLGYAPGVSGSSYQASGSHTTVLAGTYQTWMIDQPERQRLANVRIPAGASVQLGSDAHVYGRLTMDAGATLTQGQGNTLYYHGPLPDASRGSYQVYTTKIMGNLALTEDVVMPATTNLFMGDSATLNLNGHKLDVSAFWTGGPASTFVMPGLTPAESLIVRDRVYLWGNLDFRGGVIVNYGDLTQMSAPTSSTWLMYTKTVFRGNRPHQIFNYNADSVLFANLDILDGGTVTTDRHVVMDGLLTLGPGSTLTMGQSNELRVNHVLPAVEQGTLNASSILVRGDMTMDADRRYRASPFMLRVTPSSHLRLNGHTLDVAGTIAVEGGPSPAGIITDNTRDSLIVGDRLYLYGQAFLSAGTLVVRGDITQDTYSASSLFAASGTHTTVLAGTYAQHLQMPASPGAHFQNLQIDNAAGVDIDTDLDIRGQLRGSGAGVIRSGNGRTLNVLGGLDVAGLVLDGTPLNVTGGALTRFDNVTFRNFAMFQPAQLRIRHGGGMTFTMNNLNFLTDVGPGAFWIDADDVDPATGPLQLDVTSPQWARGPASTSSGSAVVTWRAPTP